MSIPKVQVPGVGSAGRVGLGLMSLTVGASPPSEEVAFAAIKAAVDAGATVLNSANGYGPPGNPLANVKLLNRFFTKYPEYADKTILVVKGGLDTKNLRPNGSIDFLRENLKEITDTLGSAKKLDIYTMGRVPQDIPMEEWLGNMATLKNEGHFTGIGLSEVTAASIRKANAITPISSVENELSLFAMTPDIMESLDACTELKIPLTAYAPMGKGLLSGVRKSEPVGPRGVTGPRSQPGNLEKNLEMVSQITKIAEEKGVPTSEIALAYILHLSPIVLPIPGSSNVDRVNSNIRAANLELSKSDLDRIQEVLKAYPVHGDRYAGPAMAALMK